MQAHQVLSIYSSETRVRSLPIRIRVRPLPCAIGHQEKWTNLDDPTLDEKFRSLMRNCKSRGEFGGSGFPVLIRVVDAHPLLCLIDAQGERYEIVPSLVEQRASDSIEVCAGRNILYQIKPFLRNVRSVRAAGLNGRHPRHGLHKPKGFSEARRRPQLPSQRLRRAARRVLGDQ